MKNEEKYKTIEERENAFSKFCYSNVVRGCRQCPAKAGDPLKHCPFIWLALEAKEIPLPCPFCGGEAEVCYAMFHAYVKCRACHTAAAMSSTKQEALAKWNRRVK